MAKIVSRYKDTPKYVTKLAQENRINQTAQEEKLWLVISNKKLNGFKFRRQFPIGRYIVDFYNHANRLVIEIDGSVHNTTKEYDGNRDAYLQACGYKVLRFTNSEINLHINTVIQKILESATNPQSK
jgi:very-short-patch-repair endonuclease